MPTIKKIGNIVFTILNTILIISLLLFSTVLILSVNSNSPSILGFSSKLIFNRTDESAMLVISQISSKLSENQEFVYLTTDGVGIFTADTVDETIVTYRGIDNSVTSSILLASPEYGGKVLIKNAAIGEMLSTLVKTESIAVVYVLIIGTFSLLLLLIFLVHYLFKNKDKLVEYYEEVEEEIVDENGNPVVAPIATPTQNAQQQDLTLPTTQPTAQPTMAETFEEIPEVVFADKNSTKKKKNKKRKKNKNPKDAEVLDLIDGIEKSPRKTPSSPSESGANLPNLSTPPNPRKRQSIPKSTAMPASNFGDDVLTYEFEINEDTGTLDNDSFLSQSTLNSMYSEDDILAVLTEPNATFVVEEDEEDYYEDGNVKYFNNGIEKPTLQESLIAYVHTNPDVDPEPPLPIAKTNDGIPIEWFESILEVATTDPRLPEVFLEDFEIKPTQIEEPVVSARDIMDRVEDMSTFKRTHQPGGFTVVEPKRTSNLEKPSADSLLQEIDSLFQKDEPIEQMQIQPEPQPFTAPSFDEPDYDNAPEGQINENDILNEIKEQFG